VTGVVLPQNAALLWTGGKDGALALHEARAADISVTQLVTFMPELPSFRAHPLPLIEAQARAMSLPHRRIVIAEPFEESYVKAIQALKGQHGVDALITGDIAEVGGYPNWIHQCAAPSGMPVLTPLWGRDRRALLEKLLALGFDVRFSCVKKRWLDAAWVGRRLDEASLAELEACRLRTGLDLCGEEGEYHTMLLNGPDFHQPVRLRSWTLAQDAEMAWMDAPEVEECANSRRAIP